MRNNATVGGFQRPQVWRSVEEPQLVTVRPVSKHPTKDEESLGMGSHGMLTARLRPWPPDSQALPAVGVETVVGEVVQHWVEIKTTKHPEAVTVLHEDSSMGRPALKATSWRLNSGPHPLPCSIFQRQVAWMACVACVTLTPPNRARHCSTGAMAIAPVHTHLMLACIAIEPRTTAAGVVDADATFTAVPGTVVDVVVSFKTFLQVVAVAVQVQQHL